MTPHHSLEVERKYDVDPATVVPDWTTLPGVAHVGAPEPRELDARYFDSADTALAAARVALRRRTGGPDEGWHLKQATPEGTRETQWPLTDAGDTGAPVVPAAIAATVAHITAGPFAPVARIRNSRTAYALTDAAGGLVAEFVDDRVTATDLRRDVTDAWREWELELGPAAPVDAAARGALFAAADALVAAAGGRIAASASKLARTLGR